MYLSDLLRISARQVFRQRRRYWGVVLAITLGTAGLITIFTMGQDVKRNINADLDLIGGATVVRCFFDNQLASVPQWFRPTTLEAIRNLPGVARVTSVVFSATKVYKFYQWCDFPAVGVDEYFWEVRNLWPLAGRLFGVHEIKDRQKVVVLGENLAQRLFGQEAAVGQVLQLENDLYLVIGVLGGLSDHDMASKAYFPLTTLQDRFLRYVVVDRIYVRCQTWDDVTQSGGVDPGCGGQKSTYGTIKSGSRLGSIKTCASGGLVGRVFRLSVVSRHFTPGWSWHHQYHDGRRSLSDPGNRPEKGLRCGRSGYFGAISHGIPMAKSGGSFFRRPTGAYNHRHYWLDHWP